MKPIIRLIGIFLPVTALVLVVIQIVISNEMASLGKTLGSVEREISLESEIREALATQVASASSLLVIRSRAESQGFVEPSAKQIIHIETSVPVAFDAKPAAVSVE